MYNKSCTEIVIDVLFKNIACNLGESLNEMNAQTSQYVYQMYIFISKYMPLKCIGNCCP